MEPRSRPELRKSQASSLSRSTSFTMAEEDNRAYHQHPRSHVTIDSARAENDVTLTCENSA